MNAPTAAPILIVDDDREIRETVADILSEEGYSVETATDGSDALTRLRNGFVPSLILLDLMMPVLDGPSFCREWKQDATLSQIPVVILSADRNAAPSAIACGATGYLTKPFHLTDLLTAVSTYQRR